MDHKENLSLIKAFTGLRVTDVRDGMDWMGYHHYGSLPSDFRPLYRTTAVGIARTARYLPYEGPVPHCTPEEYTEWVRWYYTEVHYEPFLEDLQEGDFMCIDMSDTDVGVIGSCNSLFHRKKGCVGFLINGSARDTDEQILQQTPLWCKSMSHNMCQARSRFYEKDKPVAIGGVAIYPGDVIVADGDGVIAVPRKIASDVAKWAWHEASADKATRRKMYGEMGFTPDETV